MDYTNSRSAEFFQIAAAVGLSLGVSQIAASFVILTQIISGVANIIKMGNLTLHIAELKLSKKEITHLSSDSEELINYKSLLKGSKVELRNSIREIKQNMHRIAASILCLIPVVGLIAASAYLSATDKVIANGTPVEMRTAAMAKLLIMGGPLSLLSEYLFKEIYPISGQPINEWLQNQNNIANEKMPEIQVRVDRGDGKKHEICCHYKNTTNDPSAKTMVLFHGNAGTGCSMIDQADQYIKMGWNVMMVTMGGYPGSDEGVKTNEASTIQDVNAVIQHLKKLGVTEIGVHGLSIGGTLAAHAMKLEPELVNYGVLEKTLNNVPGVAANMFNNFIASDIARDSPLLGKLLSNIPPAIVWGVIEGALNPGREVPGVSGYFTDGLDNVEKVKGFKHNLVVIGGKDDDLMGIASKEPKKSEPKKTFSTKDQFLALYAQYILERNKSLKYPRNFSHELAEAHEASHPDAGTFHEFVDGGHVGALDSRTWNVIENGRLKEHLLVAI